jgi:hypothetical protein
MPCPNMPHHATPRHAMSRLNLIPKLQVSVRCKLYYVIPCHVMPRHITSCQARPRQDMPHYTTPGHNTFCLNLIPKLQVTVTSRHNMSCHIMPRHATSRHVTPRHVMPCQVTPCHVTSQQYFDFLKLILTTRSFFLSFQL